MHENRETSAAPVVKPGSRSAGEGNGRTARAYVSEESHGGIVPMNHSNKDGKPLAESGEGRPPIKENVRQPNTNPTQSGKRVSQGLAGVRKAARENKEMKFTALLHHLTIELLRESFYSLKRKAAPGADGVTWQEYEPELEDRLVDLHSRVHHGAYRATPSRRVYIEKADGRQRPLAVPIPKRPGLATPPDPGALLDCDAESGTTTADPPAPIVPLATLRPFHQPRVGHQHLVSPLADHVLHPSRVRSYFDHYPRHCQCLEELPYIFLRCPQLSFGQRFSLQTKNAVLTPAFPQIHSHRQTISIGANGVSPAIFFCARRYRRRIQFSRQLSQDFREYFFGISLHWTSRFRPLQGWFTPLRRLAMLLQGRSPFSCDCTLSALITASLTPSVIGGRPSHPI